ncbi:MAG: hypothetical protein WBV82_04200 [Myxococcaceae bacterium]
MKTHLNVALVALVLASLTGCATWIDVQRTQPPILKIADEQPGIGLLVVHAEDDVMARAPNDFSNMTGLIVRAAKNYFAGARPETKFVDYTDLGFEVKWLHDPDAAIPWEPEHVSGVPAGVQTPLVTLVKIVDWRTHVVTVEEKSFDAATISLVFSTWTREGQPVKNEYVEVHAREGAFSVSLKVVPNDFLLVQSYKRADGNRRESLLAADREKLFWSALNDAVGYHYFPFLQQKVLERFVLIDDEPYKPGVLDAQEGRFDDALAKWTAIYEADPKAHGALYNAGLIHVMKGEDEKALELFTRAIAGDNKLLYRQLRDSVRHRVEGRRTVGPSSVTAGPTTP